MNLKDEKMPKVKIVLDNGEGDVQEFKGKGLIFALVDYEEVEEKDKIGMNLNVGIHGMYPLEAIMEAHQALDSKLQDVIDRRIESKMLADGLAQLLGLMK
jgi:hypothetical protein